VAGVKCSDFEYGLMQGSPYCQYVKEGGCDCTDWKHLYDSGFTPGYPNTNILQECQSTCRTQAIDNNICTLPHCEDYTTCYASDCDYLSMTNLRLCSGTCVNQAKNVNICSGL
jgi:hypothetical protein